MEDIEFIVIQEAFSIAAKAANFEIARRNGTL
jgi:hypothetical protein